MFYSSCRGQNDKILRSSFWLPIINSCTSLLAATVLFAFLGHISHEMGISIADLAISGIELPFVAYPAMLAMLPGSNLWSIVFFIMLVTVGIDSIFATFDFMQAFLYSEFPVLRTVIRKEIFALIIVVAYFTCGLMFCLQQGIFIFELFDHYAVGLPLLFLQLMNVFLLGWKFDLTKLDCLVTQHTGETFPKVLYYIVKYILFAIMIIIVLIAFIAEFENPLELPWWAFIFGWSLMMFPIMLVLGGCCVDKKRLLCCLNKFTATNYVIEYEIEEEKNEEKNPAEEQQNDELKD